ncbi:MULTISPECIES: long-chain fatty acid--CoA ligase [Pseudonocardia]|uniref:Long-chain fatty acid--CoA ligase n=1 Tax=Pseudonocardia abyssalis TaxID=2792008 RepID=A0ABS6V1L4_9PSEU|nr:long-chain fatty acid--CoA ligase [Pseudonocardia abyssalis]MBW0113977.1 long-chain fatty acid--CoA ligase [Pseudonocardia abyssalis]MBW0138400.1 long-chain fatty acid--CoA ligase [Pseudonocardia abyssalis]
MDGLIMDRPLLMKQLLWRAERVFGDKRIISRTGAGEDLSYTYAEYAVRARKLAQALTALGVQPGDRVGTLAWNTHRHYEAYVGVPCMGAVLHTVNLRLFDEQIAYIINHGDDRVLLIDPDQIPLVERLAPDLPGVQAYVVLAGEVPETTLSPVHSYEELLAAQDGKLEFPDFPETTASAMCYTSGTTGDPKGVLYSHRSVVLHTLALCLHGSIGVREEAIFLAISPMFHANSWGIPFAAALQGATLVLPGPHPEPKHYLELIDRHEVTHAVGAVTIGVMMRDLLERDDPHYDVSSLEVLWLGGQAPPRGLMKWFADTHGIVVPQGWGMTEASPLVTFTALKSKYEHVTEDEVYDVRGKQGLPLPLCEVRLVDEGDNDLPWDGKAVGEYHLRSPWMASAYYDDPRSPASYDAQGWFKTGDVGVIDPDGYVQLTDRSKDLIKSGGEWISSVELENSLMAHPAVAEASVVAVPHDKWLERPLACVVTRSPVTPEELTAHLLEHFARWWIPEEFLFVDAIPKTGVGKFDKKVLRARFGEADARERYRAEVSR